MPIRSRILLNRDIGLGWSGVRCENMHLLHQHWFFLHLPGAQRRNTYNCMLAGWCCWIEWHSFHGWYMSIACNLCTLNVWIGIFVLLECKLTHWNLTLNNPKTFSIGCKWLKNEESRIHGKQMTSFVNCLRMVQWQVIKSGIHWCDWHCECTSTLPWGF